MNSIRIAGALVFATFVTGCGTSAILERDSLGPKADESVIVIGVKPKESNLMLFPGTIVNSTFNKSGVLGAAISGKPKDGYVIAKAKAGKILGLTAASVTDDNGFTGAVFSVCGNTRAPAFEVPRGKLVYLGDIEFERDGQRLLITYTNRLQAAADHLRSHYPNLKGDLGQLDWEPMPTASACD